MGVILLLTVLTGFCLADTLTLRDGRVFEGSFAGGDERQVRMTVGGKVEVFEVSAVAKLEFSAPPVAQSPDSEQPPPQPAGAANLAEAKPAEPAPQPAAGSAGTLNGLAALIAIVAAAPNVDKAPEFVPNPFMTLPTSSQPKTK